MNLEEFKLELQKSYNRIFKIGLFFFIACSSICTAIFVFGDINEKMSIILLILLGLFVLIGLGMMTSSILIKGKIRSESHELIQAIKNKTDLIVWVYQHTLITKNEMIDRPNKNFTVMGYKSDGKHFGFMVKTESQAQDIITFLSSHFNNALVGYSEENRKKASSIIGKEIKRSFFNALNKSNEK